MALYFYSLIESSILLKNNNSKQKEKQFSNKVAEAMVSKINYEAEEHRKK